jgi:hypothetical protein
MTRLPAAMRRRHGRDGGVDGEVPRTDDAHHAERLRDDARARRAHVQGRRHAPGRHPALQPADVLPDVAHGEHDVEHARLDRGPVPEVEAHRVHERLLVVFDDPQQSL